MRSLLAEWHSEWWCTDLRPAEPLLTADKQRHPLSSYFTEFSKITDESITHTGVYFANNAVQDLKTASFGQSFKYLVQLISMYIVYVCMLCIAGTTRLQGLSKHNQKSESGKQALFYEFLEGEMRVKDKTTHWDGDSECECGIGWLVDFTSHFLLRGD